MSGAASQTISSSRFRGWTLPFRSARSSRSLNSVGVRSTSRPSTVTRCAVLSMRNGPTCLTSSDSSARFYAAKNGRYPQHKLLRAEWLRQIVVRAHRQAFYAIALLAASRQHEDGDAGSGGIAAQLFHDLETGKSGQHQVEHDDRRLVAAGHGESLSSARRRRNGKP